MTGIAPHPGGYVAVMHPGTLTYFTPNFDVNEIRSVPQIQDGHSVCYYHGAVYVVSSGTDQVLRVWDSGKVDVFWESSSAGRDTVHMNSIQWHRGECIISAFGRKKAHLWRSADEGYVYNITTGKYLMKPLYHPHSVTFIDGVMWVCESSRLAVVNDCGVRVQTEWGYLRGLCEAEGFLYVGSTIGRNRSKSTGALIDNQADAGFRSGSCGIGVIKLDGKDSRPMEFIDLSVYADEIYDIVPLSPAYERWQETTFNFQRSAVNLSRLQHAVQFSYAAARPEQVSRPGTSAPDCKFVNSPTSDSRS
jgi:hypothetical protein